MDRYTFRLFAQGIPEDEDYAESDARSSPPHPSSPIPQSDDFEDPSILLSPTEILEDPEDEDFYIKTSTKRRSPLSDTEKARLVLQFMRDTLSRFSLRQFLQTIFTSDDGPIKNFTSIFLAGGGHLAMMELWWELCGGLKDREATRWVVNKAASACSREASWLSDRASEGPNRAHAQFLRVSSHNVDVEMLNTFRIFDLLKRYEEVTPHLQTILKTIINKENMILKPGSRHTEAGRTLITSMLLNLRSRRLNYHATINTLLFWDNCIPKRLVQAFNHFGITTSYSFQVDAVTAISKNAMLLAQQAANDPSKIKMLPYDNFNWISRAWESSALHGTVTHDEVSALLVILPTPPNDIHHFAPTQRTRHDISPAKSLSDILPNSADQLAFRANAIIHVAQILTEDIKALSHLSSAIPSFEDPMAIPPHKTEEYYLPTFDQEQGSTRGNMDVLEHYFGKVLKIPKETFEQTMFAVLGDRLTTVRDRAAQDQRAVDRSTARFDHLSSLSMVSGLMHFVLNFIEAEGKNAWGTSAAADSVSLSTLRDCLPNRSNINLQKVDYYAWLRFLDVILRSLTIQAAIQTLNISSAEDIPQHVSDYNSLERLSAKIVDNYTLPSPTRLEALGQKKLPGNTICGHAIILKHNLMTLREMQHAIKYGHPQCIQRMIKFWLPMFYAAGSYNYANECMELLHNMIHDWPKDFAQVAFNGMLVNPSGKPGEFKPTDIRVEHLNDRIKERAHGSNATPDLLSKITPAMGHISQLTDRLFSDLNIEHQNQQHVHVSQHRDIELLVKHFIKEKIFDFESDVLSEHPVVDLYRSGCIRLAGNNTGHSNHLKRHILHLRTQEGDEFEEMTNQSMQSPEMDEEDGE
ncbi:hypothetical protein BJ912DRAFT_1033225 [Pholiota molesta]|nr:hypothetical protein BJ912DRAFT_1033225 [Pholiota molesta]